MSEDKDKPVSLESLKQLFKDPTVSANVARIATSTKPIYYSSKSNLPYYKKEYGIMMQEDIDSMIKAHAEGKPCELVYRYETWCGLHNEIIKPLTLYNRINQSIRYVLDVLDTQDHKYLRWKESVNVERDPTRKAVVITFNNEIAEFNSATRPRPELIEPHAQKSVWEQQLENWIIGTSHEPFVKTGLLLSETEVNSLKARFATLDNLCVEVTSHSIRIVRMS